jgi:competence protein ComEA
VLGAGVLVIVLGASDIAYVFRHGGDVLPDYSPTRTADDSTPGLVTGTRPVSREQEPSRRGPAGQADGRTATSSVPRSFQHDPLVFLSTAPADSLELLPGIGPVLATRLLEARRGRGSFTSWDDVLRVRGIGPKTIERLQSLASRR